MGESRQILNQNASWIEQTILLGSYELKCPALAASATSRACRKWRVLFLKLRPCCGHSAPTFYCATPEANPGNTRNYRNCHFLKSNVSKWMYGLASWIWNQPTVSSWNNYLIIKPDSHEFLRHNIKRYNKIWCCIHKIYVRCIIIYDHPKLDIQILTGRPRKFRKKSSAALRFCFQ